MPDVTNAIEIDKSASKIKFSVFCYLHRNTTKHSVSMLDSGEAIVDVAHVPVNPGYVQSYTNEIKEPIQHLLLEPVILLVNRVKRYLPFFVNLMYVERLSFHRLQIANSNGSNASSVSVWIVVEAFAGIVNDKRRVPL